MSDPRSDRPTPGPWQWSSSGYLVTLDPAREPHDKLIGIHIIDSGYLSPADRAVIQAAPDLLRALERCLATLEGIADEEPGGPRQELADVICEAERAVRRATAGR